MPSPKKNDKTRDLKEKLFRKPVPAWDKLSKQEKKQVFTFAGEYRDFLNRCRTERLRSSILWNRPQRPDSVILTAENREARNCFEL